MQGYRNNVVISLHIVTDCLTTFLFIQLISFLSNLSTSFIFNSCKSLSPRFIKFKSSAETKTRNLPVTLRTIKSLKLLPSFRPGDQSTCNTVLHLGFIWWSVCQHNNKVKVSSNWLYAMGPELSWEKDFVARRLHQAPI